MSPTFTLECDLQVKRGGRGAAKQIQAGHNTVEPGRLPRITRLMALAIRFEEMIRVGRVRDYAALARLGKVTRARMTQIMNLLLLAPDLQEALLFLPRIQQGRAPVLLADLQPIAQIADWTKQRRLWKNRERARI